MLEEHAQKTEIEGSHFESPSQTIATIGTLISKSIHRTAPAVCVFEVSFFEPILKTIRARSLDMVS